jgi:outer membrane protein assembly factor BamD (BamD/ComL family)
MIGFGSEGRRVWGFPEEIAMSVSSVSSGTSSIYSSSNTNQNDPSTLFKQMASAIQDGDLQDAQAAYSSLSALLSANQSSQSSSQNTSGNSFSNALSQIGSALQSGNIGQAQQALQSLQQAGQAKHHGGHHHHGGGGGGGVSATASTDSTTTATSTDANSLTGVDLTI